MTQAAQTPRLGLRLVLILAALVVLALAAWALWRAVGSDQAGSDAAGARATVDERAASRLADDEADASDAASADASDAAEPQEEPLAADEPVSAELALEAPEADDPALLGEPAADEAPAPFVEPDPGHEAALTERLAVAERLAGAFVEAPIDTSDPDAVVESLQDHARELHGLETELGAVARESTDPLLQVQSLVALADAYAAVAEKVRALPLPPGLNDAQVESYRQGLESFARQFAARATDFYQQAVDIAATHDVHSPSVERARGALMHHLTP